MKEDIKVSIEEITPKNGNQKPSSPMIIIRGILALLAGTVMLFWPQAGLAVVAIGFGAVLLIDGIERLVALLRSPRGMANLEILRWFGAILRIILACALILRPTQSGGFWLSILFVLVGFQLIMSTLMLFRFLPSSPSSLLSKFSAVLMLLLGAVLLLMPLFSALLLLRVAGILLVLHSVVSIAEGLGIR
ncbi:MAG: DUF308 domain-containing protein [Spirochaetales bacterium]|nr:DUF308 domain-containing protein [Spirochaetales bacterium]